MRQRLQTERKQAESGRDRRHGTRPLQEPQPQHAGRFPRQRSKRLLRRRDTSVAEPPTARPECRSARPLLRLWRRCRGRTSCCASPTSRPHSTDQPSQARGQPARSHPTYGDRVSCRPDDPSAVLVLSLSLTRRRQARTLLRTARLVTTHPAVWDGADRLWVRCCGADRRTPMPRCVRVDGEQPSFCVSRCARSCEPRMESAWVQ